MNTLVRCMHWRRPPARALTRACAAGVPRLVEPSDVVELHDELCMSLYLAVLLRAFNSGMQGAGENDGRDYQWLAEEKVKMEKKLRADITAEFTITLRERVAKIKVAPGGTRTHARAFLTRARACLRRTNCRPRARGR